MPLLCMAVFAELHNCNRDCYGLKPKIFTICFFTEKIANLWFRTWAQPGSLSSASLHSGPFAAATEAKCRIKISEKALSSSALKKYTYFQIQVFFP